MRQLFTVAAVVAAFALGTTSASAQDIAVTNARLVIGDGSAPIEGGTVVVRGGKVVAAGANVAVPTGMRTVDADGKYVTPGLVAGYSQIGLVEIGAESSTNDSAARSSPYSAAIDISPALNPLGAPVSFNRSAGVTRALVVPGTGRDLFHGRGALVDLGADRNMLTRARLFQYVEFGEAGASRAGGSRAATFLHFRELLAEARRYASNSAGFDSNSEDAILRRADAEALARVIDGRERLFISVNRASDILNVLGLRGEFPGIKMVLVGASEGWTVAQEIASSGVPVIASPLRDLPSDFESLAATQSNIGRMHAAGVDVSIASDNSTVHRLGEITQHAGNLVALARVPRAAGLSWDDAFAAISSGPARAAGVDNIVGSLQAGRAGDVVIWSGDPLELSSVPLMVVIDGIEQPLGDRQDRLLQRYIDPREGELPNAYDR